MKLNIYGRDASGKRAVVKTYETDTYFLMLGVCEDVAAAINLDAIKTGSDVEIIKAVGALAVNSMSTVKDLLKDVFDGITDDELKNTRVVDLATVLVDIVKYTIAQLSIGAKTKN